MLLVKAEKKIDFEWNEWKEGGQEVGKVVGVGFALALGGGISYATMMYMWFRVYHFSFTKTVVVLAILLLIGLAMTVYSRQRVGGRERSWLFWSGVFFAVNALTALVVGFPLYFQSLAYYWRYESMRTYTNVAAAQQAFAFNDGGMLLWTEDTRLDPMRAVGFKSRWTGQTYCAAPIVDSTMSSANDINYWAVGENCCSARAEFHCDDAADPTTRSALVLLEPEDVVRPFMQWAVQGAVYPRFERAIKLEEATYFTRSAPKVKLVQWTKDPIALKNKIYSDAAFTCIWVSILLFFLFWGAGCIVAKKNILPRVSRREPAHRMP